MLSNDALPAGESGTLVISSVGTPSAGGSVSNTGAALLYTPAADFSGTETVSLHGDRTGWRHGNGHGDDYRNA